MVAVFVAGWVLLFPPTAPCPELFEDEERNRRVKIQVCVAKACHLPDVLCPVTCKPRNSINCLICLIPCVNDKTPQLKASFKAKRFIEKKRSSLLPQR